MPFIKVDGDKVTLGGAALSPSQAESGEWFFYSGPVFNHSKFVDGIVVEDTATANAHAIEGLKREIRKIESVNSDDMAKANRQALIALFEYVTALVGIVGAPAVTAALPVAQAQLQAANKGYQRVKAVEETVVPLREQIKDLE